MRCSAGRRSGATTLDLPDRRSDAHRTHRARHHVDPCAAAQTVGPGVHHRDPRSAQRRTGDPRRRDGCSSPGLAGVRTRPGPQDPRRIVRRGSRRVVRALGRTAFRVFGQALPGATHRFRTPRPHRLHAPDHHLVCRTAGRAQVDGEGGALRRTATELPDGRRLDAGRPGHGRGRPVGEHRGRDPGAARRARFHGKLRHRLRGHRRSLRS